MKLPTYSIRLAFAGVVAFAGVTAFAAHHAGEHEVTALKHVVALKFNEEATSEQVEEAVGLVRSFATHIPEVKAIEGGENVTIEDADKGFTHVFVLTFENQADLKVYLPHPYHLEVVEKIKHLFADVFVVDYFVY